MCDGIWLMTVVACYEYNIDQSHYLWEERIGTLYHASDDLATPTPDQITFQQSLDPFFIPPNFAFILYLSFFLAWRITFTLQLSDRQTDDRQNHLLVP